MQEDTAIKEGKISGETLFYSLLCEKCRDEAIFGRLIKCYETAAPRYSWPLEGSAHPAWNTHWMQQWRLL